MDIIAILPLQNKVARTTWEMMHSDRGELKPFYQRNSKEIN